MLVSVGLAVAGWLLVTGCLVPVLPSYPRRLEWVEQRREHIEAAWKAEWARWEAGYKDLEKDGRLKEQGAYVAGPLFGFDTLSTLGWGSRVRLASVKERESYLDVQMRVLQWWERRRTWEHRRRDLYLEWEQMSAAGRDERLLRLGSGCLLLCGMAGAWFGVGRVRL